MSAIDLYAVLGVPRDASASEIEAAWRAAVAGLGPTDPSFRVFNQAGEVLLDPRRRERYDADLAAAEASEAGAAPEPAIEPAATEVAVTDESPAEPEDVPQVPVSAVPPVSADRSETPAGRIPRAVPTWLLALLAVLVIATGAAAISLADDLGRALPDRSVPSSVDEASDAVRAAEQAAPPVLQYDYRTLPEDRKAAMSRMSPSYAKEYAKLFDSLVKENAAANKSVITAQVIGSAVNRIKRDRVDVLLFVNRERTDKAHPTPETYREWVTFEMVRDGDRWRVDGLETTRPA